MVNFLLSLLHPQVNNLLLYEVMRDFRMGGLTPVNYADFISEINSLPKIELREEKHLRAFDRFGFKDVTEDDFNTIMREVNKRIIQKSKKCWHPNASSSTCDLDNAGNIKITAAHSLQNNGILSRIAENSHVVTYDKDIAEFHAKKVSKNVASTFFGFCNTHDAIFRPIEVDSYNKTDEQNFLFAYRGFVVSAHAKYVASNLINYGAQADNDISENIRIFNDAIKRKDYSIIETEVFELPNHYPFAATASFYLDYDFEGNPIVHSDDRMEYIFISFFPIEKKSYFLLSFFKKDSSLYKNLGYQIRKRNNVKSDVSVMLAGHVENIFFNPIYFSTFIEKFEHEIEALVEETQQDLAMVNDKGESKGTVSFTSSSYLENKYGINLFGY
jgi:hypothetical protein